MLIKEITTTINSREAQCFVVDYDRLLPSGWPLLTPVEDYVPRIFHRRRVDHVQVLELLRDGVLAVNIAERVGCHKALVSKIKLAAAAADAEKARTQ